MQIKVHVFHHKEKKIEELTCWVEIMLEEVEQGEVDG